MKKFLKYYLFGILLLCSTFVIGAQTPKYIFLFIGDGMGFGQVELSQRFAEKVGTNTGDHSLFFTTFPVATNVCTYSASHPITCSSAAATALASGTKTNNEVLGMDSTKTIPLKSLASQLKEKKGYKVGIITSASIDHATPGGFYAAQPHRSRYYEIGIDAANSGFDFFGGAGLLEPRSKRDPSAPCLYDVLKEKGYTMYRGMDAYRKNPVQDKILLFPSDTILSGLKFAIDRKEGDMSLADLTQSCIDNFEKTAKKGFFMMVEGGEIDWASHAHDAATAVKETLDFDQCVRLAYEFYKKHPNETLIMVTADHETGGLALGTVDVNLYAELLQYQKCSQETITAEMQEMKSRKKVPTWEEMKAYLKDKLGLWEHVPVTAREELELIVSYENSFLKKNAQNVVTLYAKDDPFAVDAVALLNKKACVGWTTKSHTGSPVPLYVVGKQADLYSGRRDNTDIPNILKREFKLSK